MLVMNERMEGRVKTLLARIERLRKVQSDIVLSPRWNAHGIDKDWLRAQRIISQIYRDLGVVVSIHLREAA